MHYSVILTFECLFDAVLSQKFLGRSFKRIGEGAEIPLRIFDLAQDITLDFEL